MNTIPKRSFAKYFFLSILTLGIYGIVMFCKMGDDVNRVCEGDGKNQMSYVCAWLLGFVTFGIYPLVWVYKAMDRLKDNAYRYGTVVQYGGSDYLLWILLGAFIFVGPFVAIAHYIQDLNQIAEVYDYCEPAPYHPNPFERANLRPKPKAAWQPAEVQPAAAPAAEVAVSPATAPVSLPDRTVFEAAPDNSIDAVGLTEGFGNNKFGRGKITGIDGMFAGAVLPIQHQEVIKIGRDPAQANLVIEEPSVSSLHCTVQYDGANNCYVVTDYSRNGVFLEDGRRLGSNNPTRLPFGTVIQIVDIRNSFKLD